MTFLIIFLNTQLWAQQIQFNIEKTTDGAIFWVENKEYCEVSVKMNLELRNMQLTEILKDDIFIIPALATKYRLFEIRKQTQGKYGYSYKYTTTLGNVHIEKPDDTVYDLPFEKGKQFIVGQGYNGSFTHQNEFALDFDMPFRTIVTAARTGVVVAVVQHFTDNCLQDACKQMGNKVIIAHTDGSFATYVHLFYNGALVKVGDSVKKGQHIALSGNTGYATGPHLHFSCFLPSFGKKETFKTKFRINNGNEVVYLEEKNKYQKLYD